MSAKKIDDLFRQKLSDHTVVPGEQAWAKLQKKMKPATKAPAIWMQVAAAVTLLAMAGLFFLLKETQQTEEVVVDRTVTEPKSQIVEEPTEELVPVPKVTEHEPRMAKNTPEVSTTGQVQKKRRVAPAQSQGVSIASAENRIKKADMPLILEDLQRKEESIEAELPENPGHEAMETAIAAAIEFIATPEVKITYIAGDDERFLEPVRQLIDSDKQKDRKSGFSKLLASARNITNGDILADIRESKDDLFNGNLKLNKDEKVNNSK